MLIHAFAGEIIDRIRHAPAREELDKSIREQAAHYNVSVDKMRKQLEENDGINGLAEQLLLGKTLDFLKANVNIEQAEKSPAQTVASEQKT